MVEKEESKEGDSKIETVFAKKVQEATTVEELNDILQETLRKREISEGEIGGVLSDIAQELEYDEQSINPVSKNQFEDTRKKTFQEKLAPYFTVADTNLFMEKYVQLNPKEIKERFEEEKSKDREIKRQQYLANEKAKEDARTVAESEEQQRLKEELDLEQAGATKSNEDALKYESIRRQAQESQPLKPLQSVKKPWWKFWR